ncbi:MAG: hypothetical protein JW957_03705 [Candidatus Omnitrophica bacterium]|nr:hypothetical protein [Candidatus Omnitrophota bacterium]
MPDTAKEKLIGARIPSVLKESLDKYCAEHGVKMSFFVSQAIREKLLEVIEDENDLRVIRERLKKPDFATSEEFNDYISRRGMKP